MLPTPLLLLATPPTAPPLPPFLPCESLAGSRTNTRDLPEGTGSAGNNELPWCYNLNQNNLPLDASSCDDFYSMANSGKVRLCVADGTGDPASSDGKCDSTAFFYCP